MTALLPRDVSVPIDGEVDGIDALRTALDAIAPSHAVRYVVQRLALTESGRPAGELDVVDALLACEGNVVVLRLAGALAQDPEAARAVAQARRRIDAWLDAHDAAGREATEIVLDADGGHEVRVAFDLDVSPAEATERPAHPAVHDGTYHATHRSPDLDALRDRLADAERTRVQRIWSRLRAAITRRD